MNEDFDLALAQSLINIARHYLIMARDARHDRARHAFLLGMAAQRREGAANLLAVINS